ncbi:hypothetical protein QOZ80_6AG0540590 [Eleusine coracana subsp. coracana]|nr:hypothetical protein QOZ80_6AG0540590 [Eleusine coracana subsp. coracana]
MEGGRLLDHAHKVVTDDAMVTLLPRCERDYENIAFRDGELVEDFSLRLGAMITELSMLGETVSEQEAIKKLLRVVPPKFEQIALSIETLLDLSELSLENVTGRLKTVEDRKETPASTGEGSKLLLTEEQWAAHCKERSSDGASGSGNKGGRGSVEFKCLNGVHRTLTGVYFIPKLKNNIINLGQLDERGCKVVIEDGVLRVRDRTQRLLMRVPRDKNRLYTIKLNLKQATCLVAKHEDDAWLWHGRFGHIGFDALATLGRKEMVHGLPKIERGGELCDSYLTGKQWRHAFPQKAKYCADGLLDLVHGDLCGPNTPATHGGRHYFLLLVDDYSRYMWLRLLTSKDELARAIMEFHARVEAETGRKLKPHLGKLEDGSTRMVFIGYEPWSKAYHLYDPVGKKVHVSRDVVFDEGASWDWTMVSGGAGAASSSNPAVFEFTVEQEEIAERGGADRAMQDEEEPHTPLGGGAEPGSPASPASSGSSLRFRPVQDSVDDAPIPGLAALGQQRLLMVSAEEPSTFSAAEQDPNWRKAMIEEMQSIEENHTWELVDPPTNCRPIGLKRVYKIKRDAGGKLVKHKARLVAKGYVQREGVDFEEVFAPVARMESVRLVLALAAKKSWLVHHMDVKSAFLNGELAEEVFAQQRPGFIVDEKEHKELRLRKALSGRAPLIVGVYVDDLIITDGDKRDINAFKKEMTSLFRMSDLGLLSYYLGIEVKQGKDGIRLCQSAYVQKLLEKGGMADCKPAQSPMEDRLKLSKKSTTAAVDATRYRSLVGGLRYLVHTRPNLAFAVGYVSRFMEDPREDHLIAVKLILRYIAGTREYGIVYNKEGGEEELKLTGFSDSDMAGDIDDRKSTTGVLFCLGHSRISWQAQKQRVVALSTCEAEYIAAATAACQDVWLHRLLCELTGEELQAPSKHIDVRYHFIRDCVEEGLIVLEFIETGRQLGDIFTKSLGRVRFKELCSKIGLIKMKAE